jgi:hypothetical protein
VFLNFTILGDQQILKELILALEFVDRNNEWKPQVVAEKLAFSGTVQGTSGKALAGKVPTERKRRNLGAEGKSEEFL